MAGDLLNIRPVKRLSSLKQDNPVELISFSDGHTYVIKLKAEPAAGTQKLYRDYVSGRLAHVLGLPVPPFGLVNLPRVWVEGHLKQHQPHCHWGHQFASLFIPGLKVLDKRQPIDRLSLASPEIFVKMFVFDLWIGNQDRKRTHILLTHEPAKDGFRRVYLIDHGGTLHPRSKMIYRMTHKRSFMAAYRHALELIGMGVGWQRYVRDIEAIADATLEAVFAAIPEDWNVSPKERTQQLGFLMRGRSMLADWVEGALEEWEQVLLDPDASVGRMRKG